MLIKLYLLSNPWHPCCLMFRKILHQVMLMEPIKSRWLKFKDGIILVRKPSGMPSIEEFPFQLWPTFCFLKWLQIG
uniref:Uncharacterized protein n=1 Tax=Picea sitchensis TaxID=3332 RepID=A9NXA6_PICSI|nr:unknown [Picea sitchensis]